MPNIKSQIKRVKTNNKANEINRAKRSRVRNAIKNFEVAISNGTDIAQLNEMFKKTVSIIDAACSDGIYHKNNAARKVAAISSKFDTYKKANA